MEVADPPYGDDWDGYVIPGIAFFAPDRSSPPMYWPVLCTALGPRWNTIKIGDVRPKFRYMSQILVPFDSQVQPLFSCKTY